MYYTFSCGCKVKQLDNIVKESDGLPPLEIDYYNLKECPEVWDLLGSGRTKGVFQLEKQLGRHWCKELFPENIHHLAALSAVLRPGTLESLIDGKNVTQHYCDNKNGRQEKIPIHPALEKILEDTEQMIIYQESILLIAKEIAGFTGAQADILRRGIGHKDPKILFEMEKKFLDGCEAVGKIGLNEAKTVFEIIKRSSRYLFNASVTENTFVETPSGFKKITETSIGEYVKTPSGFAQITNKFDHGLKPVFRIYLNTGHYIESTLLHKYLFEDGIKRFKDISKNDRILTQNGFGKVDRIEHLGMINTYDIEIASDDHIFWGNGIATSNSHAYAYGTIGYWSAYTKHHFPLHFYAAYLSEAKDKQDTKTEIRELIEDAKYYNINIEPPHVYSLTGNPDGNVSIVDKKILFGIIDIKGIGRKQINKLYDSIIAIEKNLNKKINYWSWEDFLFNIESTSTVINNLILVGATCGGKPRKQKALEYSIYTKLTAREQEWLKNNYRNYESLGECLSAYSSVDRKDGGPSTKKRREIISDSSNILKNSPYSTKDHPDWIVNNERELIGIPLTYSSTESKQIATSMTCADFLAGKRGKINILVEIASIRETTIKNGDNRGMTMAFVELKDSSGNISGVLFHESYKENEEFLIEGNVVIVNGYRSKKDNNSLVVTSMEQV